MTAKELLISELESTAESLQKKIASRQKAIDDYYNYSYSKKLKDMQMASENLTGLELIKELDRIKKQDEKDYAVQKQTGAKLAQLYDEIICFEATLDELKTIIFFKKRKS